MTEFQAQRDEELQRLNAYKTEEIKKLKQDRKLFEAWQKQQQTIINKKEKQEIESTLVTMATFLVDRFNFVNIFNMKAVLYKQLFLQRR